MCIRDRVGWEEASPYLVLPVLLVAAQYASSLVLSPIDPNDENATTQRTLIYGLPLLVGYFSLTVPSGLSLYYFWNTIFTSAVQVCDFSLCGAGTPEFMYWCTCSRINVCSACWMQCIYTCRIMHMP